MDNEANKPQEDLDTERLERRLASSNQALTDMQSEHRQLLEEMEQLRKRAEDLQRLRQQQECEEEKRKLKYQQSIGTADKVLELNEKSKNDVKTEEEAKAENTIEDDAEETKYINDKLEEIARLKAQFKRVQHMINTTELIENHITRNEAIEKKSMRESNDLEAKGNAATEAVSSPAAYSSSGSSEPVAPALLKELSMPNIPSIANINAASTSHEKEQLILTMMNMFQDFSSDLKSQADNLRAERERIKELKDRIIRERKQSSK